MSTYGVSIYLFKVFRRSYIFVCGLLATMFFSTTTFIGIMKYGEGVGEYLKMQEFGLLTIVCIVSAINIFNFNIEETEIEYLIRDRFKYFISGLIGSILVGGVLSGIPFIYIISLILKDGVNGIGQVLIEFIFVYLQAIVIMACVSTSICFILKGVVKRIIVTGGAIIAMSSVLGMILSNILPIDLKVANFILRTLNVHDDFDLSIYNKFLGFSHEIDFYIDKILIIILMMGIFYYLRKKERNIKYNLIDYGICIGGIALCLGLGYISYKSYMINDSGYMEEVIEENSCRVERYNMDFDFKDKLGVKAQMEMDFKENEKNCKLYLNENFKVEKVLVNGKEEKFTREFNQININFNEEIEGKANIEISYKGRINEITTNGMVNAIASKKAIFLSDEMIDWYPRLKDGKESDFILNIEDKEIVSNLEYKENKFEGKSKEVILLKGNLEKLNIDGYEIYTVDKGTIDYDAEILRARINEMEEKEELIKEIKERKQIIITNFMGFKILNGVVIM